MEQGRIEHGQYVQGDLKFAVNSADAHKTFDAVAALSNVYKIKLAKLNGIQAEPYNKQMLTTILKSVVQNAWFAAKHNGVVPAEVVAGHNARLAQYNVAIAVPTSTVDFLSKKTRATSKARPSLMYILDEAKYEANWNLPKDADGKDTGKDWMGQRYLVVKAMLELQKQPHEDGKGFSVREIFEACTGSRETKAPTRNAVGQIVNAMIEAGIATLLNPQDVKAAKSAKTTTPAPASKAPQSKKKH